MNSPPPKQAPKNTNSRQEPPKNASAKSNASGSNKSNTVNNNSYDEALEFSQSGSDESIDTQTGRGNHKASKPVAQVSMDVKSSAIPTTAGSFAINSTKLQPQQPRKVMVCSTYTPCLPALTSFRALQMRTKVPQVEAKKAMVKEIRKRAMKISKEPIMQRTITILMSLLKSKISSNTSSDTSHRRSSSTPLSSVSSRSSSPRSERSMASSKSVSLLLSLSFSLPSSQSSLLGPETRWRG
jgi:hypothetical protein